ncbi:MAG: DUF1800 domain-containing protein [Actinomycetota bacterium]
MPIDPTPENASHLWRRAAFGADPQQIAQTVADGIEATVATMFDHRRAVDAGKPVRHIGTQGFETPQLNTWFVRLAVTSPTPAIERLIWFWHGHFATNTDKFENTEILYGQLMQFRRHGMGRFDDLLKLVTRDPAMILWLDLNSSVVGKPNENYARELMELFSLGVDGGYTQADVVEAGRAFTGYTIVGERPPVAQVMPALHDDGVKTVLGQTGSFTGDDVIDLIVQRPECHRFVAGRLWTRYAGTTPPASVLDDLAAAFAERLVVRDLLVAMFTHPAFYADEVVQGLVAQPLETVINAVRGFGVDPFDVTRYEMTDDEEVSPPSALPYGVPLEMLEDMGQVMAHPPNVGGWPHNEPWLDATRSIGRLNAGIRFGAEIVEADTDVVREIEAAAARDPRAAAALIMQAFGHTAWSATTEAAIVAALTGPDDDAGPVANAITIAFTSPEVTLS